MNHNICNSVACENRRFSSLLATGDVSRGGTSTTQRQNFHTDDVKSVRSPVRSADWTTEQLHCFSCCLRMTDKRRKAAKVKCKRGESITYKTVNICGTYSSPEEAFEFCWISFTDEHNSLPKSTRWNVKLNKLHLEPHDYGIYYVNIDLRHQCGISVTESKTFLRVKRPQRRGAMRNGCFRRLAIVQTLLPPPS